MGYCGWLEDVIKMRGKAQSKNEMFLFGGHGNKIWSLLLLLLLKEEKGVVKGKRRNHSNNSC